MTRSEVITRLAQRFPQFVQKNTEEAQTGQCISVAKGKFQIPEGPPLSDPEIQAWMSMKPVGREIFIPTDENEIGTSPRSSVR